jgi:hypothetical protein
MKYILIIGSGTVVVGLLLSLVIDHFFGGWASSFFVTFLSVPVGFGISLFLFIIYDTHYPKKKELAFEKQDKDGIKK